MSRFSICPDTGLFVCEYFKYLLVREDGMVKNINPYRYNRSPKNWHNGFVNKAGYFTVIIPLIRKGISLSKLIALCFIPNPDNLPIVDHINGNKRDNNLSNLRWVSLRGNSANLIKHRLGHLLGTTYDKRRNKWRARILVDNKRISLGSFKTQQEAHQAYVNKLRELKTK